MTVVNTMRFNDNSGAMVSDSQGSNQVRKYDLFDKIRTYETDRAQLLVGMTGDPDMLSECLDQFKVELKTDFTVDLANQLLSEIATKKKRKIVDAYLKTTYGIDTETALKGEGISPQILPGMLQDLKAESQSAMQRFNSLYLLVGKDDSGCGLSSIYFGSSPSVSSIPYSSFGSGRDQSDSVLGKYVTELKRKDMENIPFIPGMAALIRATNDSSDFNQGVGGIPAIAYLDSDGITTLDEDAALLASEIVRVQDAELITGRRAEMALEGILSGGLSFDQAEKKAFRDSRKEKEIMRFLRGFKV